MLTWAIGLFLAGCIGISLGLLGGGGSILAVPILIYVMGVPIKAAIAMSLMIVGTVSLIGAIPHWRAGHLNLKNATIFGATTMLGAFGGAKAAATLPFITGTRQLLLFAGLMLMAAVLMIQKSFKSSQRPSPSSHRPQPQRQAQVSPLWHWLKITLSGLGVGLLTGLVGVGGGFAIVPALVLLLNTPMKEAVGTSLLIIAMNSAIGFLGYLGYVALDWTLMFEFMFVAGLGILAGTYLSQFVSAKQLQKGFGFFLLLMSAFILFENRHELLTAKPPNLMAQHHEASPQNFASAVSS
ncbi:MAG: sulfite exporter TauE/SafE family protein [Synechococcales cyanobacterium RM1_1_8]|nr:sulfite exporter TauE/SafE family protein [Synechococcales cyanobacterium RM1_1_8]